MKYFPSISCSDSLPSSSSYSLASTSLSNRLETVFKKAWELSILCGVEVCVIYYGPDGELKTWPEEREKVKDMAFRYSQLHEAERCKKRVDLNGSLYKKQNKGAKHLKKKKKKTMSMRNVKYPISDHYSPDQISGMIRSLELSYSTLQERLGFVEKETKLHHQDHIPFPLNHQDYTSLCQDLSNMPSSYESSLLQTSTLPYTMLYAQPSSYESSLLQTSTDLPYTMLYAQPSSYESSLLQTSTLDTNPDSYFISDNWRFL